MSRILRHLFAALLLCGLSVLNCYAQTPTRAKKHSNENSENLNSPLLSDCDYLRIQGGSYDGPGTYQQSYDTLRLYIERCYNQRPGSGWLPIFEGLSGAASGLNSQKYIYPEFREWLKSVLYLNPDTMYYCSDVSDMLATFLGEDHHASDSSEGADMGIIQYIIESGKCPLFNSQLASEYNQWSLNRRARWLDSVKYYPDFDSLTHPYDSTFPSIDELGLSILRGATQAVKPSPEQYNVSSLLSVNAIENPFSQTLTLKAQLGRKSLVTVEIFDLLGNKIPIAGARYMLMEAGEQHISIPLSSLPSGTYFARVSTDWDDVHSVKIVKE